MDADHPENGVLIPCRFTANAYCDRIRGNLSENLERAIAHYREALTVFTREAFPEQWAMAQNNLANAYYHAISRERC